LVINEPDLLVKYLGVDCGDELKTSLSVWRQYATTAANKTARVWQLVGFLAEKCDVLGHSKPALIEGCERSTTADWGTI